MPQLTFSVLELFLLALCAVWFVRNARSEKRSPLLWGALSVAIWLLFTRVFGFGILGALFSQILLIAGSTGWEMWRERNRRPGREP